MARRPGRSLAALLIGVALSACAADGAPAPTSLPAPSLSTSTTTTTITTSTIPTAATIPDVPTTGGGPTEIDAEVTVPDGEGPFPAVVLVHGGGWVGGGPSIMRPLADHLNQNGFLTVNTRYRLATLDLPSFPEAVDDVACAVRYAAAHPESDGTVAVIGHSAGAHLGALVALTGDDYGGDCPISTPGLPDKFVGLAGPYDVTRLGLALTLFFGEGPTANPTIWEAGNPQGLTAENPDLDSLIMYGDLDGLVDDRFAADFQSALVEAGSEAVIELIEGARHNDMHDPALVGDLIVAWLDR